MSDGMRDAERPFASQKGFSVSEPLDLRAMEARNAPEVCEHGSDARALLAALRETRAALHHCQDWLAWHEREPVGELRDRHQLLTETRAVLAKVRDE